MAHLDGRGRADRARLVRRARRHRRRVAPCSTSGTRTSSRTGPTTRRTRASRRPTAWTSTAPRRAGVPEGPAGGGRRRVRLPPARRHVGLEQRRAGRRRRGLAARRHALRPAPHRRDARRDGAGARRPPDRRRSSTPTPTATTATATSSSGDASRSSRRAGRRRDGRGPAGDAAALVHGRPRARARQASCAASSGRSSSTTSSSRRRRAPSTGELDARGRRPPVELIEVGPAHTGRRRVVHVPDARRRLHRRHPLHRRHADHLGRAAPELDRGVRADPGARPRGRRSRPRPADRRRPTSRPSPTTSGSSSGRRLSGPTPDGVVEATREIDRLVDDSPFAGWTDRERICINVDTAYRHRRPGTPASNALKIFGRMAVYPSLKLPAPRRRFACVDLLRCR